MQTPGAVERLRALLKSPTPQHLRIGVRNKGCAGLSYHLEYVDRPGKFDEVVEQDGVKVLIDSKALFSIIGSEMDWKEDALRCVLDPCASGDWAESLLAVTFLAQSLPSTIRTSRTLADAGSPSQLARESCSFSDTPDMDRHTLFRTSVLRPALSLTLSISRTRLSPTRIH